MSRTPGPCRIVAALLALALGCAEGRRQGVELPAPPPPRAADPAPDVGHLRPSPPALHVAAEADLERPPEPPLLPEIEPERQQRLSAAGGDRSGAGPWEVEDLLFPTAGTRLSAEGLSTLRQLAERLALGDLDYHLEIRGYADARGDARANRTLARRRAEAVLEVLLEHGVPRERMTTLALGERSPAAENTTAAGRASNRRVTIRILEPGSV